MVDLRKNRYFINMFVLSYVYVHDFLIFTIHYVFVDFYDIFMPFLYVFFTIYLFSLIRPHRLSIVEGLPKISH